MKYVLVGSNHNHQIQVFGTLTGRPYVSERAAEVASKKMEKDYPHLDVLVMPINDFPEKL